MKTEPIVPAVLAHDADGTPFSHRFDDAYHPPGGAFAQAQHVFLGGNDLPARWAGRTCFVVLETGFGLGNNFLATWDAWRRDAYACTRLVFISIERYPFTQADLRELHRDSPLASLATQLIDAWPPLTHNLHHLSFDNGRVVLMLALGDVAAWLPELVASVDAFYLDGFTPARNPQMWEARLFKAIGRLAAPGATASTWSAARNVRDGLQTAGFEVQRVPGIGGKRDITTARFAPAFVPRRAPARAAARSSSERHAVIVGAGLAGCATAWALAETGWRSTVIERREAIACETSGNPGGLFHGIVNPQDGAHARFNRAAALQAAISIRIAISHHGVAGRADGLLRLETTLPDAASMQRVLDRLGLPADYVQALGTDTASGLCGLTLQCPAWFYPSGGWVDPAGLARSFIERAGSAAQLRANTEVHALERAGSRWRLLDASATLIAEADVVVLANAADAQRLLGAFDAPLETVRGQISIDAGTRLPLPIRPVAGAGYLLALPDGAAMFGASSQRADADPAVRADDHIDNVKRLAGLLGIAPAAMDIEIDALQGRTGWRLQTDDRLPLIGAVPCTSNDQARSDRPRFIARQEGLFMFTALGSRGITWCTLGARCVAAAIAGGPMPLEASLLDAVDPARFLSRTVRRAASRDALAAD